MSNRIITGLCRNKPKASASPVHQTGHAEGLLSAFSVLMRSDNQTLMMDWRVTPMREACLSSSEIIQLGKSTLTRRGTRPGRVALSQSRNSPMSSPSSKRRSSSSAVIVAFCFFVSCPAWRQLLTAVIVSLPLKQISRPDAVLWRGRLFPMSRV